MVKDIEKALRMTGWNMGTDMGFTITFGGALMGVAAKVRNSQDDPQGMSVFRQTMKEFGLDNNLYIDDKMQEGRFFIYVGRKP